MKQVLLIKSVYEGADSASSSQGGYELSNLKARPEKGIETEVLGAYYRRYRKQFHLTKVDYRADQMFESVIAALSEQENLRKT